MCVNILIENRFIDLFDSALSNRHYIGQQVSGNLHTPDHGVAVGLNRVTATEQ